MLKLFVWSLFFVSCIPMVFICIKTVRRLKMKSKEIYNSKNMKLYLRLIKRCYKKYEDYNIVDANIKTSLFKTIGQVTLLCYHIEFLSDVISNSCQKRWIYNEYGTELINLKNIFYKNVGKVAGLSDFFYKSYDHRNEESLQKKFEEAAKNLDELVKVNDQVVDDFANLFEAVVNS